MHVIAFVIGTYVGRFLNIALDRLNGGWSTGHKPPRSQTSGRFLRSLSLLPLVGNLFLQGKDKSSRTPYILLRLFLVETLTGTAFVLIFLEYGFSLQGWILAFYFCFFLVIAVIDLEHRIIPNRLVYPAYPLALLLASLYPLGLAAGRAPMGGLLYALLGGATAFVILLIPALIQGERMGWGDVKLAGLIGIVVGFPGSLIAMGLAIVGGGLLAIVLLVFRLKRRRDLIPFGPFLCAGALAALIWGKTIVDWYLRPFS